MKKLWIGLCVVAVLAVAGGYYLFAFRSGVVEISNRSKVRVRISQDFSGHVDEASLAPGTGLSRLSRGVRREAAPSVSVRHPNYERTIPRSEIDRFQADTGAYFVEIVVDDAAVRLVGLDKKRIKIGPNLESSVSAKPDTGLRLNKPVPGKGDH